MNTPDDHPVALPPVMLSEADRDRLYAIAISALTNSRMASAASNVLREISRAKIVPDDQLPENVVAVNSHVDVRDNVTGTTRRVVLVMPDETPLQPNAVSVLSPLGAALIGLSEGHSVDWCSASGEPSSVTVLQSTASSARLPARADRHVSRRRSHS
ncbi:GreA/GreB family elongation factor [Bradyrhizobium sp. LB11.1]|uniref:GreA/GreB family elongation factor n=1 Tax=Bradyrhizobium sp. LB11.1 TaxID=3156326 RepID=UPI003392A1CB